jgi:transcription antitermination factor NusG
LPFDDHHATPAWYALWTASHCERLVRDQLLARGFDAFLPESPVWSKRGSTRRLIDAPMFPGYLFLHHPMDKASYVEVRKTRGLVQVLGDAWDRLHAIPADEVEAIRRVHQAKLPAMPHPYLRVGQRVRLVGGPLAGLTGVLSQTSPDRGVVVLSVHMLARSVAVQVACTDVEPETDAPERHLVGAGRGRQP